MKSAAPTCNPTYPTRQAERDSVLAEKARVCRVLRMRLGAELSDVQLAEQLGTAPEVICRWRKSGDKTAPTLLSQLAADDDVFEVLLRELLEARVRLGHKRLTVVNDNADSADR